jgi:hypothetical protein
VRLLILKVFAVQILESEDDGRGVRHHLAAGGFLETDAAVALLSTE